MSSISGGIDRIKAVFDDDSLVADAGLLPAGTVMARLGLERLLDEVVRTPAAGRGSGAKVLTVVVSMLAGGSFIDDADRLRSGCTARVLGVRGGGCVHGGDVFAVFHRWACEPVRQSTRVGAWQGVVCGRSPEDRRDDHRRGLQDL